MEPREDWTLDGVTFTAGSLLALPYADALAGPVAARVHRISEPADGSSLLSYSATKSGIMFTVLNNVRTELHFARDLGGHWDIHRLHPDVGEFNNIRVQPVNPNIRDGVRLLVTGFLTPPTLYRGSFVDGFDAEHFTLRKLRSAPARLDASGLEVRQRWVTSDDGTRVPYFAVGTTAALNGEAPAPTLLSAYGGFEVKNTPSYSSLYGKGLLEKGYLYALANIRGGGEFGPRWHQAALKENRHKSFEDFAAVARDLVDARITTVPQLAAIGGSNGRLLMGNMYTRYPHLFGALIFRVPLLDMKRYSHLLAGASWVSEYGNPDTSDWSYLKEFSPYHSINSADVHPTLLLTTSTKDDRVLTAPGRECNFAP